MSLGRQQPDEALDKLLDRIWKDGASLAGGSYLDGANPDAVKEARIGLLRWKQAAIDRSKLEADNNARNILHGILSEDVDSALDHSDIEAIFESRLTHQERQDG